MSKSRIGIIISVLGVLLIGLLVGRNLRSVYFIDAATGEKTKLTSVWVKQNEIEIKDRWFADFDDDTFSGIIYIEDNKEYAIIPFSYTKFADDYDVADFYKQELNRIKGVTWIEKVNDESLDFEIDNEQKLLIAVGTYSGTSYDETEYGRGIYSIPIYNDKGDLHYNIQFPSSSLVGIREGFNDGEPCYILQEVIFTEISVSNHEEITFLLPIEFVGGVSSVDVLDSDYYYYEYNGNQIIFETSLERVEWKWKDLKTAKYNH